MCLFISAKETSNTTFILRMKLKSLPSYENQHLSNKIFLWVSNGDEWSNKCFYINVCTCELQHKFNSITESMCCTLPVKYRIQDRRKCWKKKETSHITFHCFRCLINTIVLSFSPKVILVVMSRCASLWLLWHPFVSWSVSTVFFYNASKNEVFFSDQKELCNVGHFPPSSCTHRLFALSPLVSHQHFPVHGPLSSALSWCWCLWSELWKVLP